MLHFLDVAAGVGMAGGGGVLGAEEEVFKGRGATVKHQNINIYMSYPELIIHTSNQSNIYQLYLENENI